MRSLLVISNGLGEDSIGAEIVRRLPVGLFADAYPMLGPGRAYKNVCPIVGPRAHLPSQGSRVTRGTLWRDIAGGALGTFAPALKFLRSARTTHSKVVVVGDLIGVLACWAAGLRNIIYLDVYRTGYGRLYSAPEQWIIKRTCATVFCRSAALADPLRAIGVDARASGNVMMDAVPDDSYDAARHRLRLRAVTLLPGSRDGAVANFALQIAALARLPDALKPDVFVAVADGIETRHLAEASGLTVQSVFDRQRSEIGRLGGHGLTVHLTRGALRSIVEGSDVVLSQAGTAMVQALGLGRPVVSFGAEAVRPGRANGEHQVFGEARVVVPADAGSVADALARLLADPAECRRLGAIGQERIGSAGAIDEIIGVIAHGLAGVVSPAAAT